MPGLCWQGQTFEEVSDAVFALAPDLLLRTARRVREQVEIVLIAKQRKTVETAAA